MVNAKAAGNDLEVIDVLDKQIEVLLSCKPLPEDQIKQLCQKVSFLRKRNGDRKTLYWIQSLHNFTKTNKRDNFSCSHLKLSSLSK